MKAKMIHRCIHVFDLEKSLAFYKRAFGLDVVREITRAEGSRKIVYIGNDTTDFELELVWESGRTEAYERLRSTTSMRRVFCMTKWIACATNSAAMAFISSKTPMAAAWRLCPAICGTRRFARRLALSDNA